MAAKKAMPKMPMKPFPPKKGAAAAPKKGAAPAPAKKMPPMKGK